MNRIVPQSFFSSPLSLVLVMLLIPTLFLGCNDGDSSSSGDSGTSNDASATPSATSPDFGNNDANVLVAIGDSITAGSTITGLTYPQRLSSILGKTVVNAGVGGALSSAAPGQARNALSRKPGFLLMMFGTNDVFREISPDTVANNLASAIRMAKANKTVPLVATIPPNLKSGFQNDFVASINSRIRAMAANEGAILVHVNAEFGNGSGLIQADGFHPNDTGTQIIAFAFADALR